MRVPFTPNPYQPVVLLVFLILDLLMGIRCYPTVVLIWIFMLTVDDYLFPLWLLAILISYFVKYSFIYFAHLKIICVSFLLMSCKSSLQNLDTSPVLKILQIVFLLWFAFSFCFFSIRVTLVKSIILISDIQHYNLIHVCSFASLPPKVYFPSVSIYFTPFTNFTLPLMLW